MPDESQMPAPQFIGEPPEDADLWGWSGAGWYFWDPFGLYGPYPTEAEAKEAEKRFWEAAGPLP